MPRHSKATQYDIELGKPLSIEPFAQTLNCATLDYILPLSFALNNLQELKTKTVAKMRLR